MEELKNLDSLKDIVNIRFDLFKDRTAFIEKDMDHKEFQHIKYGEIQEKINGLGTYLLELGLKDEKIAVMGENSYRWFVSYMAAACGVGVIVPLDKGLPQSEILNLMKSSGVKAIIYSSRKKEDVDEIRKELPKDMIYIEMNKKESDDESLSFDRIIEKGVEKINAGDTTYIDMPIDREKLSVLLYTSGTSDTPKGVMLNHRNLVSNIYSCSCIVPMFGDYTCLSMLPLHHTYEFTLGYLFLTAAGGTVGICQGLKYIGKDLNEIKPDFILAVPALIEKINQMIEKGIRETGKEKTINVIKSVTNGLSKIGIDFRRTVFKKIQNNFGGNLKLLFCGAAPLDVELINKMEGYGFKFLQGYGLTETAPLIAGTSLKCDSPGTVGKAVENVEIRIDLSRNENENSNIGEIIAKGPNVMMGYYNDPERTKEVLIKGWFYTGDLGYFDIRGNLVITGRIKNVIVTPNGKNIYPEEMEHMINKIPYVAESMVYGKETSKGSKDIIVAVKVTLDEEEIKEVFEDNRPTDEKLHDMIFTEIKKVNKVLSSYKAIKELEIKKDEFEKTTTMKIKRYAELEKKVNAKNTVSSGSKSEKKKPKRKIQIVQAKKINDSKEIKEAEKLKKK